MGLRFHVFNKLPVMWSRDHAGKTGLAIPPGSSESTSVPGPHSQRF